jgi:hypothetical protein
MPAVYGCSCPSYAKAGYLSGSWGEDPDLSSWNPYKEGTGGLYITTGSKGSGWSASDTAGFISSLTGAAGSLISSISGAYAAGKGSQFTQVPQQQGISAAQMAALLQQQQMMQQRSSVPSGLFVLLGLGALAIAIPAGAYFLTKKK